MSDIPSSRKKPEAALEPPSERLLATHVTHELRAPLTAIHSALQLIGMQTFDRLIPSERDILAIAVKNTRRMAGLVSDILDFGKLQAGKMVLQKTAVPPRELIAEAVEGLSAWAAIQSAPIDLRVEASLPAVSADARRVIQVLTNLLSNALKFTPKGGRVEVGARPGADGDKGKVVFWVRDTGCGIAEGDLQRIFHSFEQTAAGLRNAAGTGLGLTLSKAIVELHGGEIWVESRFGQGAAFYFTLPAA